MSLLMKNELELTLGIFSSFLLNLKGIYQDKLKVVNKWGIVIKEIEITFPPKDIVVFNHEKTVALVYSNKIYFLNM